MSYTAAALCLVLAALTGTLLGIAAERARRRSGFIRRLCDVEAALGPATTRGFDGASSKTSCLWPLDFGSESVGSNGNDTGFDWFESSARPRLEHDDPFGVNPATGLPMCGALDMGGNFYGCNDSLWTSIDTHLCGNGLGSDSWSASGTSSILD